MLAFPNATPLMDKNAGSCVVVTLIALPGLHVADGGCHWSMRVKGTLGIKPLIAGSACNAPFVVIASNAPISGRTTVSEHVFKASERRQFPYICALPSETQPFRIEPPTETRSA